MPLPLLASRLRHLASAVLSGALLVGPAVLVIACAGSEPTSVEEPPTGTPTPPPTPTPPAAWPVVTHSGRICDMSGNVLRGRTIHRIVADVSFCASGLTIEPDAIIEVDGPFGIEFEGLLTARGTSAAPILFRPRTAGVAWKGLRPGGTGVTWDLRHVRLDSCGVNWNATMNLYGSCLLISGDQYHIDSVTVSGSVGVGVMIFSAATRSSRGLVVRRSAEMPIYVGGQYVGNLPEGDVRDNDRAWIEVIGSTGVFGFREENWRRARIPNLGVPYRFELSLNHPGPDSPHADRLKFATDLDVDAGVQLEFNPRHGVQVGEITAQLGAGLRLLGTPSQPVRLISRVPGQRWCGIRYNEGASSRTHVLQSVVIEDAGRDPDSRDCRFDGAISVADFPAANFDATPSTATILHVRDLSVRRFGGYGIYTQTGTIFSDSSRVLRVEDGGGLPVFTEEPNLLGSFPDSAFFSAATTPRVHLQLRPTVLSGTSPLCPQTVTTAGTWPATRINITGGHLVFFNARVRVRPGTDITMDPQRSIIVGGNYGASCALEVPAFGDLSAFHAAGESSRRITMASNTVGQTWGGIIFNGNADSTANALHYVDVTGARSTVTGTVAAVRVMRDTRGAFIANTRVTGGSGCGIARVRGTGPVFTTDFLAASLGNTVSGHSPTQC